MINLYRIDWNQEKIDKTVTSLKTKLGENFQDNNNERRLILDNLISSDDKLDTQRAIDLLGKVEASDTQGQIISMALHSKNMDKDSFFSQLNSFYDNNKEFANSSLEDRQQILLDKWKEYWEFLIKMWIASYKLKP